MTHFQPTICPLCATGCGLIAEVEDNRIVRIKSDKEHPINQGRMCLKGANLHNIVQSENRLKQPLLRIDGHFKTVSWDDALDWLAARIDKTVGESGGKALSIFKGHVPLPEILDAYAQLFALLDSPNSTGATHLCHIPSYLGFHFVYGLKHFPVGPAVPDYKNTKRMVVWGANPSKSTRFTPSVKLIPQLKKDGVKLIVIDPFKTDIAAKADLWLQIEPGTDLALGLALINQLIQSGKYDDSFVKEWTTGFDELKSHVSQYSAEWASKQTGIPEQRIIEMSELISSSDATVFDYGNGLDMHANVNDTTRVIAMLIALTGNLDQIGGNYFPPGAPLKPYPTAKPSGKGIGAEQYPYLPVIAFPEVIDTLLENREDAPKGMLVYHANPVLSCANESRIIEGLKKLDWLVVSELFMTKTAEMADLILPEASPLERFGFKPYSASSGGYLGFREPVINPVGDSRPWYDVEFALAERLGLAEKYPWRTGLEWATYRVSACVSQIKDFQSQNPIEFPKEAEYQAYQKDGFKTPSGKIEFVSSRHEELGLSPLPSYEPPPESLDQKPELKELYPLIGTSRRPGWFIHTRYRDIEQLRKKSPEALAQIHPADANERSIRDGDRVRITSREGAVELIASITDKTSAGVIVADFGWGNPGDGGDNINRLTSDDSRDPISASTPNRRFLCQVELISTR